MNKNDIKLIIITIFIVIILLLIFNLFNKNSKKAYVYYDNKIVNF